MNIMDSNDNNLCLSFLSSVTILFVQELKDFIGNVCLETVKEYRKNEK